MAKKKIVGEVPAETPEMEDESQYDEGAVDTGEVETKAKGAPRARKWNYGIVPEATIYVVESAASPKGTVEGFNFLTENDGTTVENFSANVDDWRHQLRVMLRGKAAVIIGANGEQYPKEFDHEAAAAAREAKAALKKAKAEAEAEAGEEVEA